MAAIVIADASPLIALARVNGLVLFQATAVDTSEPALPDLDEGEAASIRLALSRREPVLLLIDERAGRAVAQELGITVTWTDQLGPRRVRCTSCQRFPHSSSGDPGRAGPPWERRSH